ncbi:MAG: DTW domain-containing protein [Planctomycetaceae bacterium]|nr:DTW domain-containing protein [Planctomycetaceae bacterium]
MARSVVLAGAKRCEGCRLPPRWCVCGALPKVDTGVAVDILIHRREQWRPSSTGALLARSIRGARLHVHRPDPHCRQAPALPAALLRPDHVCWVLHPQGDSIADECPPAPSAQPRQVVLLDGNWREAGEMLRLINAAAGAAGREGSAALRVVRLPAGVAGRFWIREAPAPGQLATAEACGAILGLLGESAAAERLRLHFELHVWATLRARGKVDRAGDYLAGSPLLAAAPALLAALATRRPE